VIRDGSDVVLDDLAAAYHAWAQSAHPTLRSGQQRSVTQSISRAKNGVTSVWTDV